MDSAYWFLSEKGQKEVSRLSTLISRQRDIIKTEEAVQSQKGDTYICKRAKVTLEMYDVKLRNAEDEYKKLIAKYEACIALQEQIIYEETHKKSPTTIRAETEIESLQRRLDAFMKSQVSSRPSLETLETPHTKKEMCVEGSEDLATADLSDWKQLQKVEEHLALLRVGRPATNYALAPNNTEYGLVSDLSKKKQVKTTLKNKTDGDLLLKEQRTPSEVDQGVLPETQSREVGVSERVLCQEEGIWMDSKKVSEEVQS